jgi:hypothetical protein
MDEWSKLGALEAMRTQGRLSLFQSVVKDDTNDSFQNLIFRVISI